MARGRDGAPKKPETSSSVSEGRVWEVPSQKKKAGCNQVYPSQTIITSVKDRKRASIEALFLNHLVVATSEFNTHTRQGTFSHLSDFFIVIH